MCVEGMFKVYHNQKTTTLYKGETALLRATNKTIELNTKQATILKIYF